MPSKTKSKSRSRIKVRINQIFRSRLEALFITSMLFIFSGFIMWRVVSSNLIIELFGEQLGQIIHFSLLVLPFLALVLFLLEVGTTIKMLRSSK